MLSRKTTSVAMAIVVFVCALALMAVSAYILQSNAAQGLITIISNLNALEIVVLALLCAVLGFMLLAFAGRKVKPAPILFWGSGVFFLSFPVAAVYVYVNLIAPAGKADIFAIIAAIASAISLLAGIAACVFASMLGGHIAKGTLKELPPKVAAAPPPPPPPQTPLQMLDSLKAAGLLSDEEYEQKRGALQGKPGPEATPPQQL
jgi:hypothetical protein